MYMKCSKNKILTFIKFFFRENKRDVGQKCRCWTTKTASCLRAQVVLGEDWSLDPNIHMVAHSLCELSSRESDVLFWPLQHYTHVHMHGTEL